MRVTDRSQRRGGPLFFMALVAFLWVGGRTMIWESPFSVHSLELPGVGEMIAKDELTPEVKFQGPRLTDDSAPWSELTLAGPSGQKHISPAPLHGKSYLRSLNRVSPIAKFGVRGGIAAPNLSYTALREQSRVALGHRTLWTNALSYRPVPNSAEAAFVGHQWPPFTARPLVPRRDTSSSHGRFSVDAWAFWRNGSNATAISQGRVPIYGASQIGASAQYKLNPSSRRDPRIYFRGYRALVARGETEVAIGASVRPVASVPLRAHAEARYTDGTFFDEARAATFVVTELPAQRLPGGFVGEAYGQAGYVSGRANTAFADGQVSITRKLMEFNLEQKQPARLSVGAGAWGGVQRDAARLDLGPTVRLDLTIGEVPARVSVDWREQVAGDAAPGSGVAATLSTRF